MRLFRLLAGGVLFLVLLGGLVAGISVVQARMNAVRAAERLTEAAPLENAPPMVAFTTIALGGFRGLLADYLWLRAGKLQEDGSYFEMVQLSSWIVKLQPRFTAAAAYLAWNMSYNISVCFSAVEDRWRWVQRGIELIRDEALVYNPGDPELFRELGWIYQHKLGQDLDDANRYYKTRIASQMIEAFGAAYPPDWSALAAAPYQEGKLRETLGPGAGLWGVLAQANLTLAEMETQFRQANGALPESVRAAVEKLPEYPTLVLYLRHRWLRLVYKLEPELMIEINGKYGDLDWRLPEAHAIYWSTKGLGTADHEVHIGCERMIFQSLTAAFKSGRLIYLKDIQRLETSANISLVDAVDRSYLDAMEKHKDQNSIRGAYENFLVDAVVILYTFGQKEQAQKYLGKARARYPADRFRKNLDEFALAELAEDMVFASLPQAQAAIQAYLLQTCHALAVSEYERAASFEDVARRIWEKYMVDVKGTEKRRGLPPYPQMKRNAVREALKSFDTQLAGRLRAELQQQTGKIDLPLAAPDDEEVGPSPEAQALPEVVPQIPPTGR